MVIATRGDLKATRTAVRAVLGASGTLALEVVVLDGGDDLRASLALTASYVGDDRVRVLPAAQGLSTSGDVVVFLDPETRVRRGWLPPLRAALEDPEVAGARPLVLGPDDTIADAGGPLVGHPKEDAEALAGRPDPGARHGRPRGARRRPGAGVGLPAGAGVAGELLRRRARRPGRAGAVAVDVDVGAGRLRWGIRLPSTAGPWGDDWGDTHFAESLRRGLQELGHHVVTHRLAAHGRPAAGLDDVVLAIRGLVPIPPAPGRVNLLWVISHPEDVAPEELPATTRCSPRPRPGPRR